MRHTYFLILAMFQSVYADDPFACVDQDVADAFLGDSYRGRGEYSTSVPDGFADLNVPPGWSLVGSQTLDSMKTVVYKTDMTTIRALSVAVGAMADAGWAENDQRHRRMSGGFQASSRPTGTVLCNDDNAEALSVTAADKSGQTFVSYIQSPASQSCGVAEPVLPRHHPSDMMRPVPALRLPEGTKASNTGMGGNGHEVSSHVDISGALGRSDLKSFLEDQIRDHEWEFQSGWSSHHSSGSVWALDNAEEGLLIGTLHLFDSGVDPIRVRFSVTPVDPTKGDANSSWSGSSN